ncbi:hypothetical protein ACSBR2_030030 [Camellia fascicularis]
MNPSLLIIMNLLKPYLTIGSQSPTHSLTPMASAAAAAPASSFSLHRLRARNSGSNQREDQQLWRTRVVGKTTRRRGRKTRHSSLGVFALAAQGSEGGRQRAPPGVDTRIHWENEDEGWIGGSNLQSTAAEEDQSSLLGEKFSELLDSSSDSHYQFLGVAVDADMEEIKAAYRRLSKEYHPDTTSLPLKVASDKFMKLREVYDVLSHEQKRNFYDWTLAQEAASRQAEKMRMKLEDPYMKEIENYESVPDLVDRLGGMIKPNTLGRGADYCNTMCDF